MVMLVPADPRPCGTGTNGSPLEFKRRPIHLHVEKGQQARTNGVLPGNGRLRKHVTSRYRPPNIRQASARTPRPTLQGSSIPYTAGFPRVWIWQSLGACPSTPKVRAPLGSPFVQNRPILFHSWVRISDAELCVVMPLCFGTESDPELLNRSVRRQDMHLRFLEGRIHCPRPCWDAHQGIPSN